MTVGRIPVIEGGIQPTIFDAKGDLLTATANDTPARLAVGSDYGFLQADSTAGTGLAWNAGAWTSYTATASASSGSLTTYTAIARYQRIGKTCIVDFGIILTNIGTASGALYLSLPFTSANPGAFAWVGAGRENSLTGSMLQCVVYENTSNVAIYLYNNTTVITNSHNPRGTVVFEVA